MSQLLDCFAPDDVTGLLERVRAALAPGGEVWVLVPPRALTIGARPAPAC